MTSREQILGEFIDAWKAGRRPDIARYLARAPADERDELAAQLAAWLEIAPAPAYTRATRETIAKEPALVRALETARSLRVPLSERVVELRQRAGLDVGEVARRLVAMFGLDDERRTAAHLRRLESGQTDPSRLSRRLLDALASILGADRAQLAPTVAPAQTFFRAEEQAEEWVAADIDTLSRAALAAAPAPMDELDRLFLGGPDA